MPFVIELDPDDVQRFLERTERGEAQQGQRAVETVPLGNGDFEVMGRFWLTYRPERDEPGWRMKIVTVNGVPQCREIAFESSPHGREVRAADLRGLRVEDLLEWATQYGVGRSDVDDDGRPRFTLSLEDRDSGTNLAAIRKARRERKRKITDGLLREVAEVYRANLGSNPTQAVADHFDRAHRTAALWVQRAREAGHLGASVPGKAGER